MNENPFIITEKIVPSLFCDREEESARMIKLLTNGNNVVLLSKRRIGKTGLIQFCFEQPPVKNNFITIYIDILSTTNLREFTFLLGKEVFNVIRTRGEKIWSSFVQTVRSLAGKIGFDPLTGLPSLNLQLGDITQPEYTLEEIFRYIASADKPCVVAIDAFQQITKYPEANIEALIRSHLLRINNCRMIFSGSERHLLAQMFTEASRPFYMSSSFIELLPIVRPVYVDFICRLFKENGKDIPREIAQSIYDRFEGVTFYVQRMCNGLFANTSPGASASESVFNQSMEEILYSYDMIFRQRLSQLSTRQKELLLAIAAESRVRAITSSDFISRNSLVSSSAVQTAAKALLNKDIVVKEEEGYAIDDLFFRFWLLKNFC